MAARAARGAATTAAPSRPRGAGEATRLKIQTAAEQLFARDGFDRTTLREIARAADQRNVAAVQYHFGSKAGLLASIVERHRSTIDDRRATLLRALSNEADADPSLHALVHALVAPLAEELDSPSGRAYLRIQAQGLTSDSMRPATRSLVARIGRELERLHVDTVDSHRGRFALLLLFHALSDRARREESGAARRADREAFVDSLTRSIEGLFLA